MFYFLGPSVCSVWVFFLTILFPPSLAVISPHYAHLINRKPLRSCPAKKYNMKHETQFLIAFFRLPPAESPQTEMTMGWPRVLTSKWAGRDAMSKPLLVLALEFSRPMILVQPTLEFLASGSSAENLLAVETPHRLCPPRFIFFSFFASRFSAAFHKYIFLSIRHELGSFTFLLPARPYRPWSVQFSLAALQAEPSYLKSKKKQ